MTAPEPHFAEPFRAGFRQQFELREKLWSGRSEFQQIEVLDTVPFGRALILDGALQTTVGDEFCYHEPLVHIPLLAHPGPRNVLVIGGGDGGALRHALMHDVERVVMVEIDQLVVRACREWLPELAGEAFDDPRAELVIGEGLGYLRGLAEEQRPPFDVILVDSTDPVGPAEGLISEEFFRLARALLTPNGMLAIQTGSPMLMAGELRDAAARIAGVFPSARTYLGAVPSYPGVVWSWTVGSNGPDPSTPSAAHPVAYARTPPRSTAPPLPCRHGYPQVSR